MSKTTWSLETAIRVGDEVKKLLEPYCSRIAVAGSVRRQRPKVHDVDIVLIPGDPWSLMAILRQYGAKGGDKIQKLSWKVMPVDIYFADERSWATLLLIRTGSMEHNIMMCSKAKEIGYQLKANGSGLLNRDGQRIAGESEESIFAALGMRYKEPKAREL